ncbi:TadE/TadG family type IV pilus assembly protein [Methylopila sp. M107]|uniref:TadE/TadG family type IV pilus assembly protein n=1 Tax=Methylopila sp. M107 TaxID=1101190 RepID=UPI00036C76F2|nr:TadE/TadG family type IV pilus assembly protein [Methylopila sp. M107]
MPAPVFAAKTGRVSPRFASDARGATAVEFALLAPVLVMVLVGVLTYGLYFGAANSIQQLAADAARASIAGLNDEERATIARDHVAHEASTYVLIDPARATVSAAPSAADPNLFQVAVSYDASRMAIWAFSGVIPLPAKTITRAAVIQRGGY